MLRIICGLIIASNAAALTFQLPKHGDIVGSVQFATVQQEESLADIGKRFNVGVYEMIEANPKIDPWVPIVGTQVIIPTQFILPSHREGIVINLAEIRLYFFHPHDNLVSTYPIGIGRKGWVTPLMTDASIIEKEENPTWYPPDSIRKAHAAKGMPLPAAVPPGPTNPLGKFSLRLSSPEYLIHGTNRPGGIGLRSTSGCIRLFPEDIKSLYQNVTIGTSVKIIHEPYKVSRIFDKVYVEAHEPLSDAYYNGASRQYVFQQAANGITKDDLNWEDLQPMLEQSNGYPLLIAISNKERRNGYLFE